LTLNKVLQINTVVNSGSTGRIAEGIGNYVKMYNWQSFIAYGRGSNISQSQLLKIGNPIDTFYHGVITRLFDAHGRGSYSSTRLLINRISKIKPDVIHLHNIHGYYLNIKLLFKFLKVANIPVVWTLHDCWPLTGHCAYFDYVDCVKWQTGCYNCPQKLEYPRSYFIDRSTKNYIEKKILFNSVNKLTIVVVSKWLGDIVRKSYLSKFPINVINNGIDVDIFKYNYSQALIEKYNLHNKIILLGVASNWSPRKRLRDYLLLSKLLSSKYQLILVGLSTKQIKLLPENVIGVEATEHMQELVELYSISDIVLNLSVEETFGMTTIEGMACGTPGIVYNCTASPELITPQTGLIVENGDIKGLYLAIEDIMQRGKKYYFDFCVNRVKNYFNQNNLFHKYLKLYQSISR